MDRYFNRIIIIIAIYCIFSISILGLETGQLDVNGDLRSKNVTYIEKYLSDKDGICTTTICEIVDGISTNTLYEKAQDAIGSMITDTNTINLSYDDGIPELKADLIHPGKLLTVGSKGCQFTTISDAIISSTAGDIIFIYSGTYEEQLYIPLGKDISLVGMGKTVPVIKGHNFGWDGFDYQGRLIEVRSTCTFINIYAYNYTSFPYKGIAVGIVGAGQLFAYNCSFVGDGRDTIYIYQSPGNLFGKFYNCYIEGGSDVNSCENTGFYNNCTFYVNQSGEEAFYIDRIYGTGISIVNCYFDGIGSNHISNFNGDDDILYFYDNVLSENITGYSSTQHFEYRGYTPTIYFTNFAGDLDIDGKLDINGDTTITANTSYPFKISHNNHVYAEVAATTGTAKVAGINFFTNSNRWYIRHVGTLFTPNDCLEFYNGGRKAYLGIDGSFQTQNYIDAIGGFKDNSVSGIDKTFSFTDSTSATHNIIISGGIITQWNVVP